MIGLYEFIGALNIEFGAQIGEGVLFCLIIIKQRPVGIEYYELVVFHIVLLIVFQPIPQIVD
jgi:hypothetical protein